MDVEVVRSRKRRKTVHASIVDGRIRILMPAHLTQAQEREYVEDLSRKLERSVVAAQIDLTDRAATLAQRYDLPVPITIRWVDNQQRLWGSCTPTDGAIRISSRIARFPPWVVDAVIVHELAHLAVPDHSPAFKALLARYPKMERATGFLLAKGLGDPDIE